jgi:DNA-binding MarR family transcriptional regulator
MRAKGWLDSAPGEDARTSMLRITPAGKKLLEKAIPAWDEAQQRAAALLGENVAAALSQIVTTLRAKAPVESR